MSELPLAYRLTLEKTLLIEASAGTGKTYTLVRLMARHVLWSGYPIEQVLAVTFTNAACAELKSRFRDFLSQVQAFQDNPTEDGDIQYLISEKPATVSDDLLGERLDNALLNIDRAAVFTTHGFCQRLLQQYALDFRQSIPAPELLLNDTELREQVCDEFWRKSGQDAERAALLNSKFGDIKKLKSMLSNLLSNAVLMPEAQPCHRPDFPGAFEKLRIAYQQHGESAYRIMLDAFNAGALNGNTHRLVGIHKIFAELKRFIAAPNLFDLPNTKNIATNTLKINKNHSAPQSPFFDAIQEWNVFSEAYNDYQTALEIQLHHELKHFVQARMHTLKQQHNVIAFDDIIDDVYNALQQDSEGWLAEKIRLAYPVALIDEFQDTDDRQWQIFQALYHNKAGHSLTLIGDPKQAIYGFRGGDIHTYLLVQRLADVIETLPINHRSSQALLDGIEKLFTGNTSDPFLVPNIVFRPVSAAKTVLHLELNGHPQPALAFFMLSNEQSNKAVSIERAKLECAELCANSIAELLTDLAMVVDESGRRRLQPSDIVVLVNTHKQAALMQAVLEKRNVASVCVSRENIFASYQALDLLHIIYYFAKPGSLRAESTAHAGLLLHCYQNQGSEKIDVLALQAVLKQQGPMACLAPLLKYCQSALLLLTGGDRHLSNYWQLLELLQAQYRATHGIEQLVDWLSRQIAEQAPADEGNNLQPYLESSQNRVRIMTLHQSKGLEFGYVFLPFTALGKKTEPAFARYHDGAKRCVYINTKHADADTKMRIEMERGSENLRLLYVGLTRAKFALCCSWGYVNYIEHTALAHLLLDMQKASRQSCTDAIHAWSQATRYDMRVVPTAQHIAEHVIEPLAPFQHQPEAWQISSFSGLHKAHESRYSNPADDERPVFVSSEPGPFKGAAFGNALHHVLEHAEQTLWSTVSAATLPDVCLLACSNALVRFGYNSELARQGAGLLAELAYNTLSAVLPENCRLLDIAEADKRHELEFHLRLHHADSNRVLHILQQYGYCQARHQLGFQKTLNGLLTGKIDLLYQHNGKIFILDYKSNSLTDYEQSSLHASIRDNEYDLQYLLYTVAIHRWLKSKRHRDYSYQKHFGGIRYLYSRGLAAGDGQGIYSDQPDADLIAQLDACFDARGGADDS